MNTTWTEITYCNCTDGPRVTLFFYRAIEKLRIVMLFEYFKNGPVLSGKRGMLGLDVRLKKKFPRLKISIRSMTKKKSMTLKNINVPRVELWTC